MFIKLAQFYSEHPSFVSEIFVSEHLSKIF